MSPASVDRTDFQQHSKLRLQTSHPLQVVRNALDFHAAAAAAAAAEDPGGLVHRYPGGFSGLGVPFPWLQTAASTALVAV